MFLASKDEIDEALAAGWDGKKIWEALKGMGRIDCSYATFTRHIREYAKKKKSDSPCNDALESAKESKSMLDASRANSEQAIVPTTAPQWDINSMHIALKIILENMEWVKGYLNRCPTL